MASWRMLEVRIVCLNLFIAVLGVSSQGTDVHSQCQILYGPNSYACDSVNDVCQALPCYDPMSEKCVNIQADEQTSCGNKQWCIFGACVYSAEAPEKNSKCVFGNRPGSVHQGMNCDQIMGERPYLCYNQANWELCCGTCLKLAAGPPGCEYGDNLWNMSRCEPSTCLTAGPGYLVTCCDTCSRAASLTTPTASLPRPTEAPFVFTIQFIEPKEVGTVARVPATTATRQLTTEQTSSFPSQKSDAPTPVIPLTYDTTAVIPLTYDTTAPQGKCSDNQTICQSLNWETADKCYNKTVRETCCVVCHEYDQRDQGCEYGDRDRVLCDGLDRMSSCCGLETVCCSTCRGVLCPYNKAHRSRDHFTTVSVTLALSVLYTVRWFQSAV